MDRLSEEIQQRKEHHEREARFYDGVLTEVKTIRKELEHSKCKHELEAIQEPLSGRVVVRCRICPLSFDFKGYGR